MLLPPKLLEIIREQGHPPYRVNQIYHAIFKEGKNEFSEIHNIPKELKEFLQENYPVYSLEEIKVQQDKEVVKILFDLRDGEKVEAVLMHFTDGRNTICVSSQVGCKLGCHFCATGKLGFKRDLTAEEIVDQVLYFKNNYLKEKPITNIVFMGMGEPFLNWEGVYEAIKIMNDPEFLNIGARSITVSTSGIVEGIGKLADIPEQINLAISLHAPNQELRAELMPVAKMYDLASLMEACDYYVEQKHRRVSYEYLMLRDINDLDKDAHELAQLLHGKLCHVNLIPWNTTSARSKFQCSTNQRIRTFQRILEAEKIPTTVRVSLGQDIDAACGQLAGK